MQLNPIQYNNLLDQSGQASIEFVLTILFTLATTLLFIALAINTTKGYFAHYATFMASRTFLTYETSNFAAETNLTEARKEAESVFEKYRVQDFGIDGGGFKVVQGPDISEVFTGATLTFEQLLSPLTVIANGANATFHSESFLGKEPMRIECYRSICQSLTGNETCSDKDLVTVMDNGC